MNLPLFIARRYLFAKKSHNVINVISAISAIGMAIGTAALVIILSIYNGFDGLVKSMMGNIEPDLLIVPAGGKVFKPGDAAEALDWAYAQPQVKSMCSVLQEQVFVDYGGKQGIATAKGVDSIYEEDTPLRDHVRTGDFALHKGDVPLAAVGLGLAGKLDINPRFLTPLEIYFPSRTRKISLSNPASSIESVKVWPSCTFSINNDIDATHVIIPIESMRELLEYEDEVSAVEIRFDGSLNSRDAGRFRSRMDGMLGEDFRTLDRFAQNPSLYKMMKYEKASIFLILIFIIIIIAFNVFGSLSMLIIEKRDDTATLRALGATDALARKVFILEGWMISLLGMCCGLVAGIAFSLLQQHFGFIKMPGNFIVNAYPVVVRWTDMIAVAAGVTLIGYLTALLPVASYYRKEKRGGEK